MLIYDQIMNMQESVMQNEPHCRHYVKRKKRYCRMTLKEGEEYCGEHMPSIPGSDTEGSHLRVVCPLDNKHTCYAHKLAKHLKICNARQVPSEAYIAKGVNCGEVLPCTDRNSPLNSRLLANVPVLQIRNLIEKINDVHDEILKISVSEKVLKHDVVESELLKPEFGNKSKKHLHQASSILGLLSKYNLLQPATCYVEFGAGKDLALRCLINYQGQNVSRISGVVMAFCCHHRCQWTAYTGKRIFEENGMSSADFDIMCGMVSWATCGTGFSRDKNVEFYDALENTVANASNRGTEIGLDRKAKEEIGIKCKNILNYGRMLFLKDSGFKSELCYYVKPDISLENLCIVAVNENKDT